MEAIGRAQAEHVLAELARDDDDLAELERLMGRDAWGPVDHSSTA